MDNIGIANAFDFVLLVVRSSWDWLLTWNYKGVPFGFFLLAIAVVGVVLDYVF